MSGVDRLNRELARLDAALRTGTIDREQFRAHRRKLLLDFEERQTTTMPGANEAPAIPAVPVVSPPPAVVEPAVSVPPREPPPAPAARSGGRKIAVLLITLGAFVALGVMAWWMMQPRVPVDGSATAARTAVGAPPAASAAPGAMELPQNLAAALMQTEWTDTDVADFLQRWNRLPPDVVRAALEDPRIWLLRGETDQRLRQAREAESIDRSVESQTRVQQLEQLQSAIRLP